MNIPFPSSLWPAFLSPDLIDEAVRRALSEDMGMAGDVTSASVIAPDVMSEGDHCSWRRRRSCGHGGG